MALWREGGGGEVSEVSVNFRWMSGVFLFGFFSKRDASMCSDGEDENSGTAVYLNKIRIRKHFVPNMGHCSSVFKHLRLNPESHNKHEKSVIMLCSRLFSEI